MKIKHGSTNHLCSICDKDLSNDATAVKISLFLNVTNKIDEMLDIVHSYNYGEFALCGIHKNYIAWCMSSRVDYNSKD